MTYFEDYVKEMGILYIYKNGQKRMPMLYDSNKVGCVFLKGLPYAEIGRHDHRENAFHFNMILSYSSSKNTPNFWSILWRYSGQLKVSGGSEIGRNFLKHNKISTWVISVGMTHWMSFVHMFCHPPSGSEIDSTNRT